MSSRRTTDQIKKTDGDLPMSTQTIGGIGVPSGASKSPWGSTFRDRKNFFEKGVQRDEESPSGDQDDSTSKITRSASQYSSRRSLRSTYSSTSSSQSSPKRVTSPHTYSLTASTTSSSPSSTVGVMSHETGQKERMSDGFSQSQSDQDEEKNDATDEERIRTDKKNKHDVNKRSLSRENTRNDSPGPDVCSPKQNTRVLDGMEVHKTKENNDLTEGGATARRQQNRPKVSKSNDADKDLLDRITLLMKEKNHLNTQLLEVTDENRSLQNEISAQHRTFASQQSLSNDLKKQKESLQTDNKKLTHSLTSIEKERDSLLLLEQELQSKLEVLEKKLTKVESFYQTSEECKQLLEDELKVVKKERDLLREENNELGQELTKEQSAKQSYLKNVKKTEENVILLEDKLQSISKEKEKAVKERDKYKQEAVDAQKKFSEKCKQISRNEKDLSDLQSSKDKLLEEKASMNQKLDQSQLSSRQLKQQVDELKWEKQQVDQRLVAIRQHGSDLRTTLDEITAEVDEFGKELKKAVPTLVIDVQSTSRVGSRLPSSSDDLLPHVKKLKSISTAVLNELSTISSKKKTLEEKVTHLESQMKKKQADIDQFQKTLVNVNKEAELVQSKLKKRIEEHVGSYEIKIDMLQDELTSLKKDNSSMYDKNTNLQSSLDAMTQETAQQVDEFQTKLHIEQTKVQNLEQQAGRLLAEKVIVSAQLYIISEVDVKIKEERLSHEQLQLEREKLSDELNQLQKKHMGTIDTLKNKQEEMERQKLEADKLKMLLTTEMSLLKAQISQLEKEKNELKSKSSGSAFQPIQPPTGQTNRKVVFDPVQEKSQKELSELRNKLTLMEAENKRLLDLTQTSATMMDAGNALRKHTLEMRKRCVFLESEKKQLTDKVHTLHTSLKALRESKDRMISERLRTLQNENIALQDNIRTSETMFNKKLMAAASRIAETLKENDKLRCTLGHLQNGLGSIESLVTGLNQLSTEIQRQEQELATLRASLAGSGSNLIPAMEISERILKTHGEIQMLLTLKASDENTRTSLGRSASSGSSTLPPVFQHFPPEYITSIGGSNNVGEKTQATSRSRSHSQSQSVAAASTVPEYILQLREKMSQLHADNMSICDLLKHGQESLEARQNDVSRLRDKLLSLLNNVHVSVKIMHESREQLVVLSQQTLNVEQLTSVEFLKREVENWQDKVFACDIALKDIETRMQEDYESHNQRFSQLMSQILDLKEENSSKRDKLIANEQYIHDIEERCLNAENELFKLRKEMESVMQEALKVPEGFQLSSHGGHVSELIRSQNEDLMNLRVLLNSTAYQQSRLQAKLESIHRENTILKHQGLETERHHTKILEELYMERDYLRKMNSQLIERQLKTDEAGDMLKKIKRSQETEKEQRDFKKLSAELNKIKFALREKEILITELQHQLESQQLELLKLLQTQSLSATDAMIGPTHQTKLVHHPPSRSMRPLSADLARPSRYIITNLDHPKVVNRNPMESAGVGDFFIPLPASSTGDSVLNLNESGTKPSDERYILGFPVVTDDEGANFNNEVSVISSKHSKGRNRRHRRTASEGSDSLKSLMSSGSSASDSKPTKTFNHSSTLPRQQIQQKDVKRPGSVDSMCFDNYSPINTPTPAENAQVKGDVVGHYAQKFSEQIGEMIHQHDKVDETKPTKLETSNPVKVEKAGKSERFSAKFKTIRAFVSKGSLSEKDKGSSSKSSDTTSSEEVSQASKSTPQLLAAPTFDMNKSDETSSSTSSSNQVSRMGSFASTVDRSNSFASTISTTYSELGGESSPYSNYSLDSFSITDSMDNLMMLSERTLQRGPFFTPINPPNYTSSSDDESRSANEGNRTLKRTSASYYKEFPMPLFPQSSNHHRTTSSCDSDQLLAVSSVKIPVHRDESISISDMDKELTDQEDVQERIHKLQKKFGKVRRSSTGSITICNHSGSSMEDIKNAGD